ncbi:MAG TPA: hypothetical protein VFX22_10480 [Candidatus Kapabacteria bacterium]|nr:hypothetical protein [Candidatus Kapabacteria bacterium]
MYRFILTFCILFACTASAQQRFHWELTNGPGTDPPSILEVNTNGDIIAGSDSVILRSTDHGMHWLAFPNSGLGNPIAAVTLPGGRILILNSFNVDPLIRYAADGSGRTSLPLSNAQTLVADRSGNIYAILGGQRFLSNSGDSLIVRSSDAGDTWDSIKGPDKESMTSFSADEHHYYVSTMTGIYISSDSGVSWKRSLNGLPTGVYYSVVTGHNGYVWATGNANNGIRPFLSTDFGNSWVRIQGSGDKAQQVIARPDNAALLFGGDEIEFLDDTTIVGRFDSSIYSENHLASVDSNGNWLVSTAQWFPSNVNLYSSTGGVPWKWNPMPAPFSSPYSLTQAYSTVIAQAGSASYLIDSTINWNLSSGNSITILGWNYFNNSIMGSTMQGGVDQSFDSGRSWKNIFPADPAAMTYFAAANASTIYAGSDGVFLSTDSGNSWTETNDNILTSQITALSVDSSGTLFAGNAHGLFISSDSGNSWEKQNNVGTLEINLIKTNKSGTIVAAGFGPKVFRSNDHGVSWNSITIPAADWVTGIVLLPSGDVFASSLKGVFYWPAGSAFFDANDGLQERGVTELAADANGNLFAATVGAGVWKGVGERSLLGVSEHAAKDANIIASPNPTSSIVHFVLPSEGTWSAVAMDALGREWPMTYSITGENLECDLRKFPAGAYEIILHTGSTQIVSHVEVMR